MNYMDEKLIADIVRRIITERMNEEDKGGFVKEKDPSGVLCVKGSTVKCDKFDTGKAGDRVYLKDILTLDENKNLACGFMEMYETEFDWTLNYDEIDYVIQGTLEIKTASGKVTGNAGDVIMIPRGTSIKFSTPTHAKFIYTTYPANWATL